MKERRVVCAALRAADGEILIGIRHYSQDMHLQMSSRPDGSKFHHRHGIDQGFVDQHGVYMTREEAFSVASRACQVAHLVACYYGDEGWQLFSEGLY